MEKSEFSVTDMVLTNKGSGVIVGIDLSGDIKPYLVRLDILNNCILSGLSSSKFIDDLLDIGSSESLYENGEWFSEEEITKIN